MLSSRSTRVTRIIFFARLVIGFRLQGERQCKQKAYLSYRGALAVPMTPSRAFPLIGLGLNRKLGSGRKLVDSVEDDRNGCSSVQAQCAKRMHEHCVLGTCRAKQHRGQLDLRTTAWRRLHETLCGFESSAACCRLWYGDFQRGDGVISAGSYTGFTKLDSSGANGHLGTNLILRRKEDAGHQVRKACKAPEPHAHHPGFQENGDVHPNNYLS
eukprot:2669035-Amphidinium_carterae.1